MDDQEVDDQEVDDRDVLDGFMVGSFYGCLLRVWFWVWGCWGVVGLDLVYPACRACAGCFGSRFLAGAGLPLWGCLVLPCFYFVLVLVWFWFVLGCGGCFVEVEY